MAEDLERRIEVLEGDVADLTEALRSVLDWHVGSPNGQWSTPVTPLLGKEKTKDILNRLP